MDTTEMILDIIIAGLTISIAAIAVYVSVHSLRISKKTMDYKMLHDLQTDYRSPDMMKSIAVLQEKYKECYCKSKNLKKEFIRVYEKERKDGISLEETLNYHRRNLTYFYSNLAFLYAYGILTDEMIFNWWTPSDFEMIDKFIIPLQEAIGEHLGSSTEETKFALRYLHKIKNDSIDYFQKNKDTT
jgi:hypothetical protein